MSISDNFKRDGMPVSIKIYSMLSDVSDGEISQD